MTATEIQREELSLAVSRASRLHSDGTAYIDTAVAADAILAAGYRKPRTITTDEELESLAPDTIIRDSGEDPLELFDDGHGTRGWFIGDDRMTPMLPATVLWEPAL